MIQEGIDPNPKRQAGEMIEEEPPDPTEQIEPVGGGDQNQDQDQEVPNPPEAHQPSPSDSLPDFDAPDFIAVPPTEEELPDSTMTSEVRVEQIVADGALAEQLQADELTQVQADEQMAADRVYAKQLPEPT